MTEHVGPPPATATGDSSRISVGAAVAFAALAAIAGVVGTIIYATMGAGDEPPIRVRGGSIHLDLNTPDAQWEQVGTSDEWKIKGEPKRKKGNYYFDIDPLSGCTGSMKGKGKRIQLTHSEGTAATTIVVEVKGKKTRVNGAGLEVSSDGRTLSLVSTDGFLSAITIGTTQNCTFSSKTGFKGMGLFDY